MKPTLPLVIAILGVLAGPALAQDGPEPPTLELPVGARVRIRTVASAHWIEGFLASADAGTVSLVPEEAPPLGDNQLRLPTGDVTRLEVLPARKRQWLPGLFTLSFDAAVEPDSPAELVLGGLARGGTRLEPVTLRLGRQRGRSIDRMYWLEAIGTAVIVPLSVLSYGVYGGM